MTRPNPPLARCLPLVALVVAASCGGDAPSDANAQATSATTAPAAAPDSAAAKPSGIALTPGVAAALKASGVDASTATKWRGRGGTTLVRVKVAGDRATEVWESLRGAVDTTHQWPVVIGDEAAERDDDGRTPAAVLELARGIDLSTWLKARVKEAPDEYEADEGEWPKSPPPNKEFSVALDIGSGRALDHVWIVLVPTTDGAEVPAYLPFGGWNECPPDEVHVAALRKWQAEWGAELVCLSHDTMELRVAKRPETRDAAAKLAREQFVYCTDTVNQGLDTLRALAADRMASPVWYFWWD